MFSIAMEGVDMGENWMDENSRVYDELKEANSGYISNISKPFCMLACNLYGIALNPLVTGNVSNELAQKQEYILQHFEGDYKRMSRVGRLATKLWLRVVEKYFDLYGESTSEEKKSLEESDVPISALVSAIRRYMRYFYREGHWGLMWDLIDAGEFSINDIPVDSIPEVSSETLELLRLLHVEDYSDLRDVTIEGVDKFLDNLSSLANNRYIRMELQDVVDKIHF